MGNPSAPKCGNDGDCPEGARCCRPPDGGPALPGRCIPAWWSIGHASVVASILEPPPLAPVHRAGQTFQVGDIEALLSLLYTAPLPARFVGQRSTAATIELDLLGAPKAAAERDLDAGAFHVVLANRVGLRGQSAVVDRATTEQVWNAPIRGYRVRNLVDGRLTEITAAQAARALDLDVEAQVVLGPFELAAEATRSGSFTAPVDGEYVIGVAGGGDVDLFVRLGGRASRDDYDAAVEGPGSFERCRVRAFAGTAIHWTVAGYEGSSDVVVWTGTPAAAFPGYAPNPHAARFFLIDLELDTITNARPSLASRAGAIDRYTNTDRHAYVLEADRGGTVLGGEWLPSSARTHPDFVWWPLARPASAAFAGLTYDLVAELLDQSRA